MKNIDNEFRGDMMNKGKGCEYAPINPGWIKKRVPDSYADDVLKEMILFYVINTPCADLSSSGIEVNEYGWSKDVWKNDKLKKALFDVAGLKRKETFFVVKHTSEMREGCEQSNLKKKFHQERNTQRIVIYKGRYNEVLSVFYHIRNAFAHGRLAMYDCKDGDLMFALEDGIKRNGQFEVRSRMLLKKSTLKSWMDIIKSGHLPGDD